MCRCLGLIVRTVRRCGGVNGDGHVTDLLDPHRSGWGDQNIVVLSVQHLLVHTLQPHSFGDVGLVVVVPALGVPGKRGRFGKAAEGGKGGRRGGCCVCSYC